MKENHKLEWKTTENRTKTIKFQKTVKKIALSSKV